MSAPHGCGDGVEVGRRQLGRRWPGPRHTAKVVAMEADQHCSLAPQSGQQKACACPRTDTRGTRARRRTGAHSRGVHTGASPLLPAPPAWGHCPTRGRPCKRAPESPSWRGAPPFCTWAPSASWTHANNPGASPVRKASGITNNQRHRRQGTGDRGCNVRGWWRAPARDQAIPLWCSPPQPHRTRSCAMPPTSSVLACRQAPLEGHASRPPPAARRCAAKPTRREEQAAPKQWVAAGRCLHSHWATHRCHPFLTACCGAVHGALHVGAGHRVGGAGRAGGACCVHGRESIGGEKRVFRGHGRAVFGSVWWAWAGGVGKKGS